MPMSIIRSSLGWALYPKFGEISLKSNRCQRNPHAAMLRVRSVSSGSMNKAASTTNVSRTPAM